VALLTAYAFRVADQALGSIDCKSRAFDLVWYFVTSRKFSLSSLQV
jgi:hypothetical protein